MTVDLEKVLSEMNEPALTLVLLVVAIGHLSNIQQVFLHKVNRVTIITPLLVCGLYLEHLLLMTTKLMPLAVCRTVLPICQFRNSTCV